jgi:predicted HD phosphohydrolase
MDGSRSPLLRPEWRYVEPTRLDEFRAPDWTLLGAQRRAFDAACQGAHALRLLAASADDPGFGYQVNNYRHCIQAATAAMMDGRDEEYVVMALFHDVGFTICPTSHGAFAASLLAPYVSDANRWILEHHQLFQDHHCHDHPDERIDPLARERWRGHPLFEATAEFVERYDVGTLAPGLPEASLETFAPMVGRVFSRAPRPYAPREA